MISYITLARPRFVSVFPTSNHEFCKMLVRYCGKGSSPESDNNGTSCYVKTIARVCTRYVGVERAHFPFQYRERLELITHVTSILAAMKKRGSSQSNAQEGSAFEEFEEDEFDEDGVEDVRSAEEKASRSGQRDSDVQRREAGKEDRQQARESLRQTALGQLETSLAQTHFKFLSNRPAQSTLETLVTTTNADDSDVLDATIEIVAKCRARGVTPSLKVSRKLVTKVSQARSYSRVLELLQDRTTYGLQLEDPRVLDDAFLQFTKPPKPAGAEEGEGAVDSSEGVRNTLRLLEIERFYLSDRPRDPVGPLASAGLLVQFANASDATEQDKAAVKQLLKDFKAIGAQRTLKTVLSLERKTKKRLLYNRAATLVAELEKTGYDAEALKVAKQVQQGLSEFAPKQ